MKQSGIRQVLLLAENQHHLIRGEMPRNNLTVKGERQAKTKVLGKNSTLAREPISIALLSF